HHLFERLAALGRPRRKPAPDVAGRDLRKHRVALDLLPVAGDPVHDRVTLAPELLRRHVVPCGLFHGSMVGIALQGRMAQTRMELTPAQHEQCARALFNFTWTLLDKSDRDLEETDLMISSAHASLVHWQQVGKAVNFARGHWQVSRACAVAGRGETA